MSTQLRTLRMTAAKYTTRTETFMGREHLVVPVVALVEGVIQAMNSPSPELVTAEEFSKPTVVAGWNGRPLYHNHPMRDGEPISGNVIEVLESECIGRVFNATGDEKLKMEAWLDVERCAEVAPKLLERAQAGDPIEISVGIFAEMEDVSGTYGGKKYSGKWAGIVPDHLALLDEDSTGACSVSMGCGVRAAKGAPNVTKQVDKTRGGLFARLMSQANSLFRAAQPASEMGANDVRAKLEAATKEKDPRSIYVQDFYAEKGTFIYCAYPTDGSYNYSYFERTYTLNEDGTVEVGDVMTEVEPVMTYQPVVAGEAPAPAEPVVTPKAAACGCSSTKTASDKESEMNRTERLKALGSKLGLSCTKFLESATDEQLDQLEKAELAKETPAAVAAPAAPEAPVAQPAVAAAAPVVKAATIEDLPADVQKIVARAKEQESLRSAALVDTLKTAQTEYTEAELKAMPVEQLERLARAFNASAPVDFSLNAPRQASGESGDAPAAPDLGAAIRASRAKK